ncbi:MAG TPA: helix-turn-helix domain-containing protein [Terriglobales bacterium]|nr:helix-turn-helix domain-containing protein [Terriglobales bacterium]
MAAKRLFAQNGYENTSTVAIAREAGTSESQLMKHFGSKRGLLSVILDRGWADIAGCVQMLPKSDPPIDRLFAAAETVIIELENDAELKNLLLLETRRVRKDNRDVFVSQGFQQFAETVSSILHEMRDQGQLSPDLNLAAVRAAFIGMTEGLLRDQILAQRSEFQASYSLEDLKKVLAMLVSSLAGEASQQTLRAVNH